MYTGWPCNNPWASNASPGGALPGSATRGEPRLRAGLPLPAIPYSLFPIPYSLQFQTTGGGATRSASSVSNPCSSAMSAA
jgi:hypothetical protein